MSTTDGQISVSKPILKSLYSPNSAYSDDTICNKHPYGEHIVLKCVKCGKHFSTKNIECVGARTIFLDYKKSDIERYAHDSHDCISRTEGHSYVHICNGG